jgi:hypothetical protein
LRKRLDIRLSKAFLDLLDKRRPKWVHQEVIYQYIERNLTLNEAQKSLHIQKAGQIEPNWQHDLRNLQHSLKRAGAVINPEKEVWGLPTEEIDDGQLAAIWQNALENSVQRYDEENGGTIQSPNGVTITRQLFLERVAHLLRSGGVLPVGRFHVWSKKEQAIVSLSDHLSTENGWIVWRTTPSSTVSADWLNTVTQSNKHKAHEATLEGQQLIEERKKQGVERTVVLHRPDLPEATGSSLPFVFNQQGQRITLQSPHPLLRYTNGVWFGYSCPACRHMALVTQPGLNAPHFRHWPGTNDRLREEGRDCPFTRVGAAYSGLDAASRQFSQNLLQVRLKREAFGRFRLVTDGGGQGKGLPYDPNRQIMDYGPMQNVELRDVRNSVNGNHNSPVRIQEMTARTSINWRRSNMRSFDILEAEGVSEGDCFQVQDMSEFTVMGRGILRIRPGLDYQSNDVLRDYREHFIGVVVRNEAELPPDYTDVETISDNLRLVILPADERENRAFLNEHNIGIHFRRDIRDPFEVLVRTPISANPSGHFPIYFHGGLRQMSLLIRNGRRAQPEDEVLQPVLSRVNVTSTTNWNSHRRISTEIEEYPLPDCWHEYHFELGPYIRNSKLQVDGSLNYRGERLKPQGGLMVYLNEGEQEQNHFIDEDRMVIGFEDEGEPSIEICLFSSPPVVRYELNSVPHLFEIHGSLGQLNSEDHFVFTSVWFENHQPLHNRPYPLDEVGRFLQAEAETLETTIQKIQIQFMAQVDGRNKSNVGLPTLVFEQPEEEILQRRRREAVALEQERQRQAAEAAEEERQRQAAEAAEEERQRQAAEAAEEERQRQAAEAAEEERQKQEAEPQNPPDPRYREIQQENAENAKKLATTTFVEHRRNLLARIQNETLGLLHKTFPGNGGSRKDHKYKRDSLKNTITLLNKKVVLWSNWASITQQTFQCVHLHSTGSKEKFEARMKSYGHVIGPVTLIQPNDRPKCRMCQKIWDQ